MKNLIRFFHTLFFLIIASVLYAEQPETQTKSIVFDFKGMVEKDDTYQIADFLCQTFNIDDIELQIALTDLQTYVQNGGTEKGFWQLYANAFKVILLDNWFEDFEAVIQNSLI